MLRVNCQFEQITSLNFYRIQYKDQLAAQQAASCLSGHWLAALVNTQHTDSQTASDRLYY